MADSCFWQRRTEFSLTARKVGQANAPRPKCFFICDYQSEICATIVSGQWDLGITGAFGEGWSLRAPGMIQMCFLSGLIRKSGIHSSLRFCRGHELILTWLTMSGFSISCSHLHYVNCGSSHRILIMCMTLVWRLPCKQTLDTGRNLLFGILFSSSLSVLWADKWSCSRNGLVPSIWAFLLIAHSVFICLCVSFDCSSVVFKLSNMYPTYCSIWYPSIL